jgi:hypothetical protein
MEIQSEFSNIFSNRDNNDLSLTPKQWWNAVLPEYFNQNKTIFSKNICFSKNNFKKEQLKWESSFAPTFYNFISLITKCILKGISNRSGTKFGRENMFNEVFF